MCYPFRVPEEKLVRRVKPAHQELPDPQVPVDPLEMTVPRVTLYVSSTHTHAHTNLHDWCIIRAVSESITVSYFSVELSAARAVVDIMSNARVMHSLLIVSICLQGPVGFPGDPGPPGEPGAAVSATFIPQLIVFILLKIF